MQEDHLIEELTVGNRHCMMRLCIEDDMMAFANVSGNHSPPHTPIDMGAARTKGIQSEVAGMGGILIAPNLDAGNILFKQWAFIAHAEVAGLVIGARIPIILNSLFAGEMSRLASCAIASLYHKYHSEKT